METTPILKITDCTKRFQGICALNGIHFDLRPGELHCIVGENGAGKTTLINILSGALKADRAAIEFEGRAYAHLTPKLSSELGIQTIYQEITLAQNLSVAENIFLGRPIRRGLFVDYGKMRKQAEALLESLGIHLRADAEVDSLSIAEQQYVQIAKALARKAKVLILDEPTASLSRAEIERLLNLVRRIALEGVGIVYISHHLEEVFEIADRITVLRDGCHVGTFPRSELDEQGLISHMVGRSVDMFFARRRTPIHDKAFEARNIWAGNTVKNVSFTVRSGEILGISGMVGSGRSELLRAVFGADHRTGGELFLDGEKLNVSTPSDAIRNRISLITEDRHAGGLALMHSVHWNTYMVELGKKTNFFRNLSLEKARAAEICERLNMRYKSVHQEAGELSGGNQQKVVLAKWLIGQADVFLFDEPTKGIDVGAREEIYGLMVDLAEAGKHIVMVSSDLPELLSMSDRILVMRQGKIVGELKNDGLSEAAVLAISLGAAEEAEG